MKLEKSLIKKDSREYEEIGSYFSSKESVVGIDARHTHIIIINKLLQLEDKLARIEKTLKRTSLKTKKKK